MPPESENCRGQLWGTLEQITGELPPMPLTDTQIRKAKPTEKTQRLFDGGGLYLEISPKGGKWWRLKYRFGGKEKRLSLGVYPDMTERGWKHDAWPELFKKVDAAHILVIGSPIWLGEKSSVCTQVIERLYAMSAQLNEHGQYAYYGRVGGCLITGNEDGVKHCSMSILYAMQHLGYVIPPQADAGWIGAAGPGPSYLDEGSGGPENDFTNRNTTFMTWNLLHLARMIADSGGIPAHGNQRSKWDAGCRFDYPNPEYR